MFRTKLPLENYQGYSNLARSLLAAARRDRVVMLAGVGSNVEALQRSSDDAVN
jgi:hypothetical protein